MLREWWARWWGANDVEELDEESRFHIEMETERYLRSGIAPGEARRLAMRSFGSLERYKEEIREQSPRHALADLRQDARYGVRALRRSPAATVSALVALMLGIGLTTLMFSIVYAVLLRGLPYEQPDRLMHLTRAVLTPWGENRRATVHDFVEWKAQQRSFEELSAFQRAQVTLRYGNEPELLDGARVSAGLFETLGMRPLLGRMIEVRDERPGAAAVVVISHSVWQNRFAGDSGVIGKIAHVEGAPATVIGVMPARFGFPMSQDVWLPLAVDPLRTERGGGPTLDVIGRLKDEVTLEAALTDLNAIAARIALEHPAPHGEREAGVTIVPLLSALVPPRVSTLLVTMLGAVALVLLIACANVANILIGRGAARSREVTVRAALGASRFRIMRQFLTEAALLALGGAVLGTALAVAGTRIFTLAIAGTNPPAWLDVAVHGGVLVFVFGLVIAVTLLSGSGPAWRAARADANAALKDEGRTSTSLKLGRLSRALVVVQIALSAGLLVGAGLMIRSVMNLRSVDLGFSTRDVFMAEVRLPQRDYPDAAARLRFSDELLTRLRTIPALRSVSLSDALPGLGAGRVTYAAEGKPYRPEDELPGAQFAAASDELLTTFRAQLIAGRFFNARDGAASEPVAVINTALARRDFPGGNALGKRLQLRDDQAAARTIVGIVPDLYFAGIARPDEPAVLVPLAQSTPSIINILAQVDGDVLAVTDDVRAALGELDPELPLAQVSGVHDAIVRENWFHWVFGSLFMLFGGSALILAAIGLYGVMAAAVRQRTREIGVRMAVGANRRNVLRLVFGQGLLQLALGLAGGLLLGVFISRLLGFLLFRVAPGDAVTFVSITAVMTVTAIGATLLPALRAARVHPLEALRHD